MPRVLDPGPALRAVRDDIFMAVIPAQSLPPAKAGAGIQRPLRGACLDPGSALRAVRDDIGERVLRAPWDDVRKEVRAGWDDTSYAASRMMAACSEVRRMVRSF